MSNVANAGERVKIFEMLLSSPGMNERCKISLSPSRQTILLLNRIVESGLQKGDEGGDHFLSHLTPETLSEVKSMAEEMLKKGGLVEFYDRLKLL